MDRTEAEILLDKRNSWRAIMIRMRALEEFVRAHDALEVSFFTIDRVSDYNQAVGRLQRARGAIYWLPYAEQPGAVSGIENYDGMG